VTPYPLIYNIYPLLRFKLYCYYSWGLPLLLVVLAHMLDQIESLEFLREYRPSYATNICWFNNKKVLKILSAYYAQGLAVFFALPLGAVVLENFIFFLLTVYGIHSQLANIPGDSSMNRSGSVKFARSNKEESRTHFKRRISFLLYIKLSTLLGLTWAFGLAASILNISSLWSVSCSTS